MPTYVVKCNSCSNNFEKFTTYSKIKNFIETVQCSCGGELAIAPVSSSFTIKGASFANGYQGGPDELDLLGRDAKKWETSEHGYES